MPLVTVPTSVRYIRASKPSYGYGVSKRKISGKPHNTSRIILRLNLPQSPIIRSSIQLVRMTWALGSVFVGWKVSVAAIRAGTAPAAKTWIYP